MNRILNLRTKSVPKVGKQYIDQAKRVQFNLTINLGLASTVKFLAKQFRVPAYCLTEHMLQIAGVGLAEALKDPVKKEIIEQHLISHHLLGDVRPEDPKLLTIGLPNPFDQLGDDMIVLIRVFKEFDVLIFGKEGYPRELFRKELHRLRGECWSAINELRHNFDDLQSTEESDSKIPSENEPPREEVQGEGWNNDRQTEEDDVEEREN